MSRTAFRLGAASLALIVGMGGAGFAQQAQAPAATDLPAALQALKLTDIEIKDGPRGRKVEGDLPGGGEIEAFVDREGRIVMVDADDAGVPQSLIEALLPQAVRDSAILQQFSVIEKVGGRDGRFMVGGEDAGGEDLRAGFDQDGQLLRFGRGDDDDMRGGRDHGPRGHGHGHGKWDGDKDDRGPGDRMRRGDMPMHAPIDLEAVTKTLGEAGYTDIGKPQPIGPRVSLPAKNPAGDAVLLEVAPDGEVLREIAQ